MENIEKIVQNIGKYQEIMASFCKKMLVLVIMTCTRVSGYEGCVMATEYAPGDPCLYPYYATAYPYPYP